MNTPDNDVIDLEDDPREDVLKEKCHEDSCGCSACYFYLY